MASRALDVDTIHAGLARMAGTVLAGAHGVQYTISSDFGKQVRRTYVGGHVRNSRGILQRVENFYKVQEWQNDHATKLVRLLNYELHHDGSWAVMWTLPGFDGIPTELRMAFQDVDGDVQLVVESDRKPADLLANGPISHLNNCEKAYQEWREHMKVVDVQKNQTIKMGQGEREKDPSIQPDI